ncbi:MAG: hypothetical protein R3C12_15245 [Planctomycetaceae bacterium]
MSEVKIVRVGDVMKREFDLVDGKLTVKQALLSMKHRETRALIVDKIDADDEYGIVLISDIAKKYWRPIVRRIGSTCTKSCQSRYSVSRRK